MRRTRIAAASVVAASVFLIASIGFSSERVSRKKAETNALRSELLYAEDRIGFLESQVGDLNGKMSVLEEKAAALQSQEDNLKATDQAKISAKEADKAAMRQTYDTLAAKLKNEIDQDSAVIQNYKDSLSIKVDEELFFNSGEANLTSLGRAILDKIGPDLKSLPGKEIRVIGYTDDVPIGESLQSRYADNWILAAARADAVIEYLMNNVGIDGANVAVESRGKYEPLVQNDSPQNRAKNRRIVIIVEDKNTYEHLEGA
jgi:chemotaxis protein MotB